MDIVFDIEQTPCVPLPPSGDVIDVDSNADIALCSDLPIPLIPLNNTFFTSTTPTPTCAANVSVRDNDSAAITSASVCHAHPESQSQSQSQPQPQSQSQSQSQSQFQPSSQSQPPPQLHSELNPRSQTERKSEPQVQPLSQAQAQSQSQPQAQLQPKPQQQPQSQLKPQPQLKSQLQPQPSQSQPHSTVVPMAAVQHTSTPPTENRCSSQSASTLVTLKSEPKEVTAVPATPVIPAPVKTELVQPQAEPTQPKAEVMATTQANAAVVQAQQATHTPTPNVQLQCNAESVQIVANASITLSHLYTAQRQELRDARERISELEAQLKRLHVENETFRSQLLSRKRARKAADCEDICATPLSDIDSQDGFAEMDTTGNPASAMPKKTEAVAVPVATSSVTVKPSLKPNAAPTQPGIQIHAQGHVHAPAQRYIQAKPPSNSSVG